MTTQGHAALLSRQDGITVQERVFIAGAGPVGLVAAANLVRNGVPVTVFEAGAKLSEESRASTFHPPTLDMLETFGAAKPLIAQGLLAPAFQYRNKAQGLMAHFAFDTIADATGHPYRVQSEQSKLTRILLDQLRGHPDFAIEFDSAVQDVSQDAAGVTVTVERDGRTEQRRAGWLIGADGASSNVRRALGIEFEGFTWPERLLVISTPFDFHSVISGLTAVNYWADPERWYFLLQIPGLWRAMFPVKPEESDETALSPAFAQSLLAGVVPGISHYDVSHTTLYRVHQRVAKSFASGRVFLAGDAAHINNPLGGMGMNGGIHDAMNLSSKLAAVWHDREPAALLERYDRQRRAVTKQAIEIQTIQNKKNLESPGSEFRDYLAHVAADPERTYDYLLRVSMITSLRRADEIA
jgi:3-(3-hydroxy-phenyl)propionate hydroxylase